MAKTYKKLTDVATEKYIGSEPDENSILENPIDAYNHYSYFCNLDDSIGFLTDYMESVDPTFIATHELRYMPISLGWIARMKSRNVSLPLSVEEWFKANLAKLPQKSNVIYLPIRETFEERVLADLETDLDNEVKSFPKLAEMAREGQISKALAEKIVKTYNPLLEELLDIENDEQLTEAYSCFTAEEIQAKIESVAAILAIFEKSMPVARGRKKKVVPLTEILKKNLKLFPKDPDTNLKSMSPEAIADKKVLVFYIPSKRAVQIFRAMPGMTFGISGKSLTNFDPNNSFSKGVRKPIEVMKKFVTNNDAKLTNIFNKLTTKARPQNTALISGNHMLISAF